MMQGGGGGSNLSCQLLQAASRATPTQVTRPRQQACSQAVGDVANGNNGSSCHINIVDRNDHSHSMRPQRIHHSDDDGDCDSCCAIDADVDDDSDDDASSSASRCNSSTAAQPLKLPAFPPRPCVLQLHHSCQNHSTSQQPAQCSQPQHIPSGPHVRPFQLQQSQSQLADGTKAAQPARQPGPQS